MPLASPSLTTAVATAASGEIFTNTKFDCHAEFEAWAVNYGEVKSDAVRRAIFCDRLDGIVMHNVNMEANGDTYWKSVNEFSSMTFTEFAETFLGANVVMPEELRGNTTAFPDEEEDGCNYKDDDCHLPNSVDHRSKLPGIKQQKCQDCWAFSAVASLDFLGGKHSEQQLVDCAQGSDCSWGWYSAGFDVAESTGACSSKDYPYEGKDESCWQKCTVITKISGYKTVSNIESAASGHVLSAYVGVNNDFVEYGGGTYTAGCDSKSNHALNIVGYDSDTYLIRNSWGKSWGDKGYMHMEKGVCELQVVQYPYS